MKVAAVQATPAFLDRSASIDRVVELTAEAASEGAGLVVFPEAFVAGYPDWVWRTKPWEAPSGALYHRFVDQAVSVPGPSVDRLTEAAKANSVHLAVGINERAAQGSTIYNSILYLGPDGDVLGVHRKLIPTGGERLVWGRGDGTGLVSFDTPGGRVGGLICWENYMPLARAAMYSQGVDVYLAPTWDNSDVWVPTLQHIAREGRCYVVGVNSVIRGSDVPDELGAGDIYGGDDDWMSRGNTTIVGPDGSIIAGPIREQEGIIYATVETESLDRARMQFDVCGHYARDDVFQLTVQGLRDATATVPAGVDPGDPDGDDTGR